MNIPQMKSNERNLKLEIIPDGGINLSREPDQINENQASGMINMIYRQNMLSLRPGLCKKIEQQYGRILDVYPRDGRRLLLKQIVKGGTLQYERQGIYIATEKAVISFDGNTIERIPTFISYEDSGWKYEYKDFSFVKCVFLSSSNAEVSKQDSNLLTWTAKGDVVYLIGSGYFLTIGPDIIYWPTMDSQVHVTADYMVSYKTPYVPVLFENSKATGSGEAKEARNLLTPKAAQVFTTDASSTVYHLSDNGLDNDTVRIEYVNPSTKYAIHLELDGGITSVSGQGISAVLDRGLGTVTFSAPLAGAAEYDVKNNLVVTYSKTVYPDNPVFKCFIGSWYGTNTKNGCGSRIFLAGDPALPNAVYCSAVDNPAYFPDDMIFRIGNPSETVTAFGHQFDVLVVFKTNSIYSIASNTSSSSLFTVKLVQDGTGCDIPGSVQLVDNLLVWAHTRRGICILLSTQIKDERTVESISKNVDPIFFTLEADDLTSADAISDGDYYSLFVGQTVIVWHFGQSRINRSTAEDASDKYAYYVWKLPKKINRPFLFNGLLYAACRDDNGIYLLDNDSPTDDGAWFEANWVSGLLNFGLSDLKQVKQIKIHAACDGGDRLNLLYSDDYERILYTLYLQPSSKTGIEPYTVDPPFFWNKSVQVGIERVPGVSQAFKVVDFSIRAVSNIH